MILADAAVALSVALQFGIPPTALAKSIARIPESLDGPATKAASATAPHSICLYGKTRGF